MHLFYAFNQMEDRGGDIFLDNALRNRPFFLFIDINDHSFGRIYIPCGAWKKPLRDSHVVRNQRSEMDEPELPLAWFIPPLARQAYGLIKGLEDRSETAANDFPEIWHWLSSKKPDVCAKYLSEISSGELENLIKTINLWKERILYISDCTVPIQIDDDKFYELYREYHLKKVSKRGRPSRNLNEEFWIQTIISMHITHLDSKQQVIIDHLKNWRDKNMIELEDRNSISDSLIEKRVENIFIRADLARKRK